MIFLEICVVGHTDEFAQAYITTGMVDKYTIWDPKVVMDSDRIHMYNIHCASEVSRRNFSGFLI
jgi:hypothetical protein